MLIAAGDWHCLTEMLIIVSALSIQNPKERPQEAQERPIRPMESLKVNTLIFSGM
jgi:HrpA-like RNA helicase